MFNRRRNAANTHPSIVPLIIGLVLVLALSAAVGCSAQSPAAPADVPDAPPMERGEPGEGGPDRPAPDDARMGPPEGLLGGQVISIQGNIMSIQGRQEEMSVRINVDTVFTIDGADGTLSDIQPDMFVRVTGEPGEDEGTIDATQIDASTEPPPPPQDRQDQ